MILDNASQNIWDELKEERIGWLEDMLAYLNKVHVVHSVQVIPRKNQDVLNILTPRILQHEKQIYIIKWIQLNNIWNKNSNII